LEADEISFHDLQREFLLLYTADLSLLHSDLLAAYRVMDGRDPSVAHLPDDEPYILEHVVYHLRGAGEFRAIASLVCDLGYLARRCFRSGPHAAEWDVVQA